MEIEVLAAKKQLAATPEEIFTFLADPAKHSAIDGTGWVRDSLDSAVIIAPGQLFRMAMYHPNHPDGHYEMINLVEVFEPPYAISWKPGYDAGDGIVRYGGWTWRYDLAPLGPNCTEVTLTYDWSDVPEESRQPGQFPPFAPDHLENPLTHLDAQVNP
jgi:hypothetical protein